MKPAAQAVLTPLALRQFLLRGLLGCLLGTEIGLLNLLVLDLVLRTGNRRFYLIALFGLCGIIAGAIQGGFLRRVTRPALLWLVLSGMGWSIAGFVGTQVTVSWSEPGSVMLLGGLLGALAALPQCLLLRRSLPFVAIWLVLSASAWSIMLPPTNWQYDLFRHMLQCVIRQGPC
jgi:hypothetical protein